MSFRLHVIEDVLDLALGANDKSGPCNAFHLLAVHILFFNHAKEICNLLLRVSQQRERQAELLLKFLLRGCRIF